MIPITQRVQIPDEEVQYQAIRAQGAGGQNVNKVSTAIHLRFDIQASSLPAAWKERLLACQDQRINAQGVIVIKAQRYRSQEKNRADAIERLVALIRGATAVAKKRKATRPSKSARKKRVDNKTRRGEVKRNRGRVDY